MSEVKWAKGVAESLHKALQRTDKRIEVSAQTNLPYACEILSYAADGTPSIDSMEYETDVLIRERAKDGSWKPRIVIEMKLETVTTHDVITYSEKADAHRQVHPYLRYGLLMGERGTWPLPGRLFRHGDNFDFMASWVALEPTKGELQQFVDLLAEEVVASRQLEEVIFNSRRKDRDRFTMLRRRLEFKK